MSAFDTFFAIGLALSIWLLWMILILFVNRAWRRHPHHAIDALETEYDGLLFRKDGSMRPYRGFGDRIHPNHPSRHGLE